MQSAGLGGPAPVVSRECLSFVSGGNGSFAAQPFDFFLQSKLLLLQFGDVEIVAAGMVNFGLDFHFQRPVAITKLGNVRLQSHLIPSFR